GEAHRVGRGRGGDGRAGGPSLPRGGVMAGHDDASTGPLDGHHDASAGPLDGRGERPGASGLRAERDSVMGDDAATRIAYLRRVRLVAALDDAHLAALLARAVEVKVPAGQVLSREGDVGDHLYVVLSGELVISKRVREVDDVIAYRGPGEVVGEMALVNGRPRPATVRAARDSRLLRLGQRAFRDLLGRSPEAAAAIVSCMATRIEED